MTALRRAAWLAMAGLLLMAHPTAAQIEQARLNGTVTDAQGAVLPGVTVTADRPRSSAGRRPSPKPTDAFAFPRCPAAPTN